MNFMKNTLFWLTLGIFSLLACIGSYYLFPKAVSFVSLSITMNRTQALDRAQELAFDHQLGPQEYQQTVAFHVDSIVKTYTELDAGGKEGFERIITQNLFQPYLWIVRHFQEHDPHEVFFYFTPDGNPYGFSEQISENTPGATLSQQDAEHVARSTAQQWSIDLQPYALAEASQETQPSGRIDHTFAFERTDQKLGEAPYRFTAIVAGNHVRKLEHSVKVPEQFFQKYVEMRAANDGIADLAHFLMHLLYLGLCCIIGGLILLRQRYLLFKTPMLWAFALAFLSTLMIINNLPLMWIHYQTAFSMHGFLLRSLVSIIYTFVYKFGMSLIVISVAESLTRKAFGNQTQLFTSAKPATASSYQIVGQTILAYLIIPFFVLYALLFWLFTETYLDWWSPTNILFNPNILATYLPWLNPIIQALNAGFIEECLYRAIPLATAAIIGKRYGHQKWWIAGVFILQIAIFGAAHANYPMQPAYARPVELIIVSTIFGLLYLRFGLLPGIITHVIYDVFWMSLPLFVSSASGIWIQKLIIILLCLIPLFVILYGYLKNGSLHELAQQYYNAAFKPELIEIKTRAPRMQTYITRPHGVYLFLLTMGIIGLYGFMQQPFKQDAQALKTERAVAREIATDRFAKQINDNKEAWTPLITARTSYLEEPLVKYQHLYVYQVGGKKLYDELIGSYLHSPHWQVRLARFVGTFEQRAQEWWYFIDKNRPFSKAYIMPEITPGAQLSKQDAREKVEAFITKKFKLNPKDLEEVSAISKKQPNRTDWKFTYKDPRVTALQNGQAQTIVELNGDTIGAYSQSIFVPEQWKREMQDKENTMHIIMYLCGLLFYLLFSVGVAVSLIQFTQEKHLIRKALYLFAIFLGICIMMSINEWPTIMFKFNTSQPFGTQFFAYISQMLVRMVIQALSIALIITLSSSWHTPTRLLRNSSFYFAGIVLGVWFAGSSIFAISCLKSVAPIWADYSGLGSYFPYLQHAFHQYMNYLIMTSFILLIATITDYLSAHWQKNRLLCSIGLLSIGFIIVSILQQPSIEHWFYLGLIWGISLLVSYILFIRFDLGIIPIITGTYFILQQCVQATYDPYTGALFGIVGTILIMSITAYYWSLRLNRSIGLL